MFPEGIQGRNSGQPELKQQKAIQNATEVGYFLSPTTDHNFYSCG